MNIHQIRKTIIEHVAASAFKVTPHHLAKTLTETYGLDKPSAKALLKDMVAQGELEYAYEFGSTYVVPSFNRPVRISARVVIMPPGRRSRQAPDDVIIQIKPGAAFGAGQHPTTRLAVRGIEYALRDSGAIPPEIRSRVLDIGTGTGILVLTAVRFGIKKGLGLDFDPISRAEARENVRLNHLENRIEIGDRSLASIRGQFCMVTANLRLPSLQRWCEKLVRLTLPSGLLVFSGVRMQEAQALLDAYAGQNCRRLWQAEEQGWIGLVLQRSV
jgi:ribosomal protein L11 methyltransferase